MRPSGAVKIEEGQKQRRGDTTSHPDCAGGAAQTEDPRREQNPPWGLRRERSWAHTFISAR